ncbi:uncharacterized protein LOC119458249 [Dermacentor silvarum]|uniref:uncharacterized protein LOC119458249 n=1 Tax=Dermacentor silvarum TaxID=543639 RepID=UPI0018999DC0|nr:uncharacterized protein LOC119458249 [Dermacentor silvarum]
MSLESTTDLMYETAAEITPENHSPVPEPAVIASPKGTSESLEAKNSSQALTAESVYNSIASSATGTPTELTPVSFAPGPKQIKTGLKTSTSKMLETERTPKAATAESIHNSIISSRAEICAQETILSCTAASESRKSEFQNRYLQVHGDKAHSEGDGFRVCLQQHHFLCCWNSCRGKLCKLYFCPRANKDTFPNRCLKALSDKVFPENHDCSVCRQQHCFFCCWERRRGDSWKLYTSPWPDKDRLPQRFWITGTSKVLDSKHFPQTATVESDHNSAIPSAAGTATEVTSVTSTTVTTVLELLKMSASTGTSKVLDIKRTPQAAFVESVNNSIISSAAGTATELQNPTMSSATVLELPKTGISSSTSMILDSMHTPDYYC